MKWKSDEIASLQVKTPTPVSLRLGWVALWIIYPFVLLADMMSLAGQPSGNASAMQIVAAKAFLWGTLAYPIVLLICYVIWRDRNSSGRKTSSLICAFPLLYLLIPILTVVAMANRPRPQTPRTTPAPPSSLPTSQPY